MTVDEHHDYETLTEAGEVRPDGETESEDLGSLSDCQMVFLARALSSEGLALPLPSLPAPGSVEQLIADFLGNEDACPVPEGTRTCSGLADGYCGKEWGSIGELEIVGTPWLEMVRQLERESPGSAGQLIGSFQDDFYEKNIAVLALVNYARLKGDEALENAALEALNQTTELMKVFGELLYARTAPASLTRRIYQASLFQAQAGLTVDIGHFDGFEEADAQMTKLEDLLNMEDTGYAPIVSDNDIAEIVAERLSHSSQSVNARYLEHYGDTPPLRNIGQSYEATGYHPDNEWPWTEVPNMHHKRFGGVNLLEAIPLCNQAPELLDCTWARLGCKRPDLNQDHKVDEEDQHIFAQKVAAFADTPCNPTNSWCELGDLDHTGLIDETDSAFMAAAIGCHW